MATGKQMHAWLNKPTSHDPVHEIVPIPEPKEGEVLLKVKAAGLCHSDLHILEHNFGIEAIDTGTFILSHEVTGVCVKNGPGAKGQLGQLYAVLGTSPCWDCKMCHSGRDNMCKAPRAFVGLGADGGFCEYMAIRDSALVPVPKGVDAGAATSATDAILTPYHGLKTIAKLEKGQTCVVIGLGGLGLNAVSIAKLLGARVFGVDVKAASIDAASKLGVEAMNMDELQKKFKEEGLAADVVLDCVGSTKTFETGQELLGIGGAIVAMGLHTRHLPFNTIIGIDREIRALTAAWGTKAELVEILDHIAAGRLQPIYKLAPLSQLMHYFTEMRQGRVEARVAFEPEQYEKEAAY